MTKQVYKFICLATLFVATISSIKAQTTALEKKTDIVTRKAINFMNTNMPDSVYMLAGTVFKSEINAGLWANIYKNQFSKFLPFTKVTFISSSDSVNKYKLEGKVTLNCYISLDKLDKLNKFSFVPYREEVKAASMNEAERKTDTLARKILTLINHKQADSIYLFAGDYLKSQLDAAKWKNIAENGFFPLTPFGKPVFVSSKNGINKYKIEQFQFIFGSIDKQGKFNTIAVQPYVEDPIKTIKVVSDNKLATHLDTVVNKLLSTYMQTRGNVGVSIGVYYQGKDYFYNFGETKQGSNHLPANNTFYEIGSITKTFTSTLLAIAVDQGKVGLQMPIIKFLPDSVAANPALKLITFKELANHTSGLPRMPDNFETSGSNSENPYGKYNTNDMFSYLMHFKQTREPGAKYEYSNFGAGLLGILLERMYKKPYAELLKEYITGPAKINDTRLTLDATDAGRLAQGYDENIKPVPAWEFIAFRSAGALKSTSFDLLNYGKLQLFSADRTLSKALKLTHEITFNDNVNIVGLGWHYFAEDQKVLNHGGATGGYRSMICTDPESKIVVAVLTNNASTGDKLGLDLIEAIKEIK